MFSNLFKKAALLGSSTVASVALTGTMMGSSAQAATMSYTSNFSVTSNSLDDAIVTGDFTFTKTKLDTGFFSYKLEDFNASVNASVANLNFSKSFTFNDVKANSTIFEQVNQAFVPDKYQAILPSALADEDSNYIGDGDFPPPDFTREFSGEEFSYMKNDLTPLVSTLIESSDSNTKGILNFFFGSDINNQATVLLDYAFGQGGEISLTSTSTLVSQSSSNLVSASVPEPTTIFGIGIVGVGLVATRRKRAIKKNKHKAAA